MTYFIETVIGKERKQLLRSLKRYDLGIKKANQVMECITRQPLQHQKGVPVFTVIGGPLSVRH
jgi:hypothetical protein